jgi:hypothetical protein
MSRATSPQVPPPSTARRQSCLVLRDGYRQLAPSLFSTPPRGTTGGWRVVYLSDFWNFTICAPKEMRHASLVAPAVIGPTSTAQIKRLAISVREVNMQYHEKPHVPQCHGHEIRREEPQHIYDDPTITDPSCSCGRTESR